MKTKVLFGLLVTAVVLIGFTSCKENYNTMEVINGVSLETFRKTPFRAAIKADEKAKSLTTVEYNFVSRDTIKKTVGVWGEGTEYSYSSQLFTYLQGDLGSQNVGQYYTLFPVGEGKEEVIKFENNNFLTEDGYVCNQNFSTIAAIGSVDEDFANSDWTIDTIVYWTQEREDTIGYDTIKHIEPKPEKHWVIDTILPHMGIVKDTLCPKYIVKGSFSFSRNEAFKNTGNANYQRWSYAKDTTKVVVLDSIKIEGDMTWSLKSMASAKKFTILTDFSGEIKYLDFSDFSVTRDKETQEVTNKTATFNEFPLTWVKY
ncbi:MAG: hypothetical protein MJZ79_03825 [Paludibacteraceae bacterium]|nr:hypothetical protein [Paludibacteraceae bacterium]